MLFKKNIFIISVLFFLSTALFGQENLKRESFNLYGRELEFTNDTIYYANKSSVEITSKQGVAARTNFKNDVLKKCPDCKVENIKDKYGYVNYRIHHPNGFWFDITLDPGVIEIKTMPMTTKQMKKNSAIMKTLIYDIAQKNSLVPDYDYVSAGHIHLGIESAFKNDPLLFRNFVVDLMNRPELAWGIFNDDPLNAPHILDFTKETVEDLKLAITEFDKSNKQSIELLAELMTKVYKTVPAPEQGYADKYHAINVTRIVGPYKKEEKTIELRAMRMPKTADAMILMHELLDARLEWLKKQKGLIKLDLPEKKKRLKEQEMVNRFFEFVVQTGGPWDKYRSLMGEKYLKYSPDLSVVSGHLGLNSELFIKYLEKNIGAQGYKTKKIDDFFKSQKKYVTAETMNKVKQILMNQGKKMSLECLHLTLSKI